MAGDSYNDDSRDSKRFLHRLRACRVKVHKLDNKIFRPPSARRTSGRKTFSQLRREDKMRMQALLSRPEDERLEVFKVPEIGRGVKARVNFEVGDYIIEYCGEFCSGDTGRYMEREHERDQSGSYQFYFWYKSDEYCIDATSESAKMGRLINHSKRKANALAKVLEVKPGEPRLILEASRKIKAGEEIRYDYGENRRQVLEELEWLKK